MPLIHYLCSCGKNISKFYRVAKDAPSCIISEDGVCEYKRQLSSPSSKSVIQIDNGVQAKSVEVNLDTIESNQINSTKDFREK